MHPRANNQDAAVDEALDSLGRYNSSVSSEAARLMNSECLELEVNTSSDLRRIKAKKQEIKKRQCKRMLKDSTFMAAMATKIFQLESKVAAIEKVTMQRQKLTYSQLLLKYRTDVERPFSSTLFCRSLEDFQVEYATESVKHMELLAKHLRKVAMQPVTFTCEAVRQRFVDSFSQILDQPMLYKSVAEFVARYITFMATMLDFEHDDLCRDKDCQCHDQFLIVAQHLARADKLLPLNAPYITKDQRPADSLVKWVVSEQELQMQSRRKRSNEYGDLRMINWRQIYEWCQRTYPDDQLLYSSVRWPAAVDVACPEEND